MANQGIVQEMSMSKKSAAKVQSDNVQAMQLNVLANKLALLLDEIKKHDQSVADEHKFVSYGLLAERLAFDVLRSRCGKAWKKIPEAV